MRFPILLVAVPAMTVAAPVFACASCGCTLTSDWLSQGLVAQPGTTVSLRYDYIGQHDLRAGGHRLDRAAIAQPSEREIERYTDNHYLTATLDRQIDTDWGVNLQLPLVYRDHSTVAEGDVEPSGSRTHGIGDVRLTARWQGFKTPGAITGVQFGLVLPTGRYHQTFHSGPQDGEGVDRGLQPGLGVVQAVLGGYRYGKLAANVDYIVQFQGQASLDAADDYRPGVSGQASAGVHYTRWRGITPQLQLNLRAAARDRGDDADRRNSGGVQLDAAPGLIAGLGARASAFAYVALPLYRHVYGYQLVPRAAVSVGLQYRL